MSTIKEQEELVEILKFTPRTYTLMLSGYGGEIVLGSVPREQYQYFRDNEIDIEEYAWDCDNEQEVPEEMQPFFPGEWHSCDDIAHESGVELCDSNRITVTDENGKEHWQCKLGYMDLTDAGAEVDESDEYLCSDREDRENTVGFVGQSIEKGCFFEGELELTAPFDPAKLSISYSDIEGWSIVNGVTYDGVDIEGTDGYNTNGKGSEFKFYDTGEDDA
jgi:hypothetical protein